MNNDPFILVRYHEYYKDMVGYTNLPHYTVLYKNKMLYDNNITFTVSSDFSFGTPEEVRARGKMKWDPYNV